MSTAHKYPLWGLLVTSSLGCSALEEGEPTEGEWLIAASEVQPALDIPCAQAVAEPVSFEILIDDNSGYTLILEKGSQRVWLREPFGLVPDTCWWLPDGPVGEISYPEADCFSADAQYGSCTGAEDMDENWVFHTPGVAMTSSLPTQVLALDGTALFPTAAGIERLDLTPTAHEPIDESETSRSFLRWLSPLELPDSTGDTQFSLNNRVLTWWDQEEGNLYAVERRQARRGLSEPSVHPAPRGEGLLVAAGDFAAILSSGTAHVYDRWEDGGRRRRRSHRLLNSPLRDALVDPVEGVVFALIEDGVLALADSGPKTFFPAPGAEGLVLGRPDGVPTVYAWGNQNQEGLVYRLEKSGNSTVQTLDRPILGMGTGEIFQELTIAFDDAGVVVLQSFLDQAHRQAIASNPLKLALAAFIESPRDDLLNQPEQAAELALELSGACDGLEEEALVCCVHDQRAEHLDAQLAWLDQHLNGDAQEPAAVLLGLNPTAIAQSIACEAAGYPEWAASLPQVTANWANRWEDSGVGSLALLLHTPPFTEAAGYVQCPESWVPSADCWQIEPNADAINQHLEALTTIAQLSPWTGKEPHWSMLGGGYEGFGSTELPSWIELFPKVALPNASLPQGLYFGLGGMNPLTDEVAAKDLAPFDASRRPFPISLGPSPTEWDHSDDQDRGLYYPGQTYALPWLYESRRSGLLFVDFTTLGHPKADWNTDRFTGPESPTTFDEADSALALHYLKTRVLAHRETGADRWWYIHLHDLSSLANPRFEEGWVHQNDPDASDSAIHTLIDNISDWSDVIDWSHTPTPTRLE
jgi:hypothetical protein